MTSLCFIRSSDGFKSYISRSAKVLRDKERDWPFVLAVTSIHNPAKYLPRCLAAVKEAIFNSGTTEHDVQLQTIIAGVVLNHYVRLAEDLGCCTAHAFHYVCGS